MRKTGVKRNVNKPDGGDRWPPKAVAHRARLEKAELDKKAKETVKNKRAKVKAVKETKELLNNVNTEQLEEQEEVHLPNKKRKIAANSQKKAAK